MSDGGPVHRTVDVRLELQADPESDPEEQELAIRRLRRELSEFDAAVVRPVALPGQKFGLAVSPDGTRVYVANSDLNTVSVIDAEAPAVIRTIDAGAFTQGVAISPNRAVGYVAQESAVGVFTTDASAPLMTIRIPDAGVLEAVAVTPDGGRVIAVTRHGGRLIEIDAATQTVTTDMTFDPTLTHGDVAVTDDRAYISVRSLDSLFVFDISGG